MKALLIDVAREVLQAIDLSRYTDDIHYLPGGVGEKRPGRTPILLRHYDGGHLIHSSHDSTIRQKRAYRPGHWWQGYAGRLLVTGVGRGRQPIDLTADEIQAYQTQLIFQHGPPSEWDRPHRPCRQEVPGSGQLQLTF